MLLASGIAPINQPQTLARVREFEVKIALLEGSLLDSQAASASADGPELRRSLWICAGVGAAGLALLCTWLF